MTPGDEMLDAADPERALAERVVTDEQRIIALALVDSSPRGPGGTVATFADDETGAATLLLDQAEAVLAALKSNGVLVFSSEQAVWVFVRERVLASGPANAASAAKGDERECDTGMGGCGGTHTECYYRSLLSAALDAAERGTDA